MRTFIAPYAIEVEKFFRLVLFNYLIHNGDAHLKNFSLIRDSGKGIYVLAPAYDLLNTRLHLPHESDTALDLFKDDFSTHSFTANAFYAKDDFLEFGNRVGIRTERVRAFLVEFASKAQRVEELLGRSYLETDYRSEYAGYVKDRIKRISYSLRDSA
ncbi:MAG: HipA domain-containing protein [Fibrobacterota bacterium]|nr:HipA domain-containing protein [Fibrobacterota bacterium]